MKNTLLGPCFFIIIIIITTQWVYGSMGYLETIVCRSIARPSAQ